MQATVAPSGLAKYIPILGWLPGYPRGWLRVDLVAGLTAAAVVIPQAMAYASLVGFQAEFDALFALALETEETPSMNDLVGKLEDTLTRLDAVLDGDSGEPEATS